MKDARDSDMLLKLINELKYRKVGNIWKSYAIVVKPVIPTVSAQEVRKPVAPMTIANKKTTNTVQSSEFLKSLKTVIPKQIE